jgi:hypothetical protein
MDWTALLYALLPIAATFGTLLITHHYERQRAAAETCAALRRLSLEQHHAIAVHVFEQRFQTYSTVLASAGEVVDAADQFVSARRALGEATERAAPDAAKDLEAREPPADMSEGDATVQQAEAPLWTQLGQALRGIVQRPEDTAEVRELAAQVSERQATLRQAEETLQPQLDNALLLATTPVRDALRAFNDTIADMREAGSDAEQRFGASKWGEVLDIPFVGAIARWFVYTKGESEAHERYRKSYADLLDMMSEEMRGEYVPAVDVSPKVEPVQGLAGGAETDALNALVD